MMPLLRIHSYTVVAWNKPRKWTHYDNNLPSTFLPTETVSLGWTAWLLTASYSHPWGTGASLVDETLGHLFKNWQVGSFSTLHARVLLLTADTFDHLCLVSMGKCRGLEEVTRLLGPLSSRVVSFSSLKVAISFPLGTYDMPSILPLWLYWTFTRSSQMHSVRLSFILPARKLRMMEFSGKQQGQDWASLTPELVWLTTVLSQTAKKTQLRPSHPRGT